ncbi:unnamed protein product (macronuclear) [Paramecium tetraurelia]|uniref:Paired domain-containing protein n=1 Tax=Paramecium tetraurelia TaxID=5888 RepID=A0EGS9_PARTE|nr:uncharacterized protein GSPATT00026844001 [Paramecium tetraurelia]CAK94520.1 unnamed protein product [Paramecium tetraurelia]|eukprot:XP_001461893.1 hypothetical protein (macronuclear) [Paramecium tetraurelia strain d4-2]
MKNQGLIRDFEQILIENSPHLIIKSDLQIQSNKNIKFTNMDDSKKQYSKIKNDLREQIIHKILKEKKPIMDVAQEHNLLQSTCKSIINTYMREGRVGKKESRVRKLKKVMRTYEVILNPLYPQMSTIVQSQKIENCVEKSKKGLKEESNQNEKFSEEQELNNFSIVQQWCDQIQQQLILLSHSNQFFQNTANLIQK